MILINSSPKDALKIFQPFLPIFVPIGVGCLAASCENEGIKVHIADEQVEEDILGLISRQVAGLKRPYIFAFSVLTAALKSSIELSRQLRRLYPDSVIVFGGIHPSAMPEEVLAYDHIDFVIRGEGERALIDLYKSIKDGRSPYDLNNLSFKESGKFFHNDLSPFLQDLDKLPDFPYHLFKSKKYDLGFVISSRGCPHRCIFCSNRITTGKKYRFRSANKIAEELELLYKKYDKKNVLFLDDNLLVSKDRIYRLLEEIKTRGLDRKMTFRFQARGDNVDFRLLDDLYQSGFRSIFFGIETASENLMKVVKKDESVAECIEAVRMAKKIGFYVSATFIYALPEESHQDRIDSLKLSKDLRLDMVRFNNATPYPGTELYDMAKAENRLYIQGLYENFLSVSTFIENPFNKIPFSYVPKGNSERKIREDILLSYLFFYLDFNKLKEVFVNPGKGVGWFNAGESLLTFLRNIFPLSILALFLIVKFFDLALDKLLEAFCIMSHKNREQAYG
ncbi:MAG: B12-binding domain-containing radical SAM protein [Candidatus Omnitrophica bacterium]|nr:B12-binding domain-containing radical SAM protein [Candidatus Omnitrophota bacterium]